MFFVTCCVSAFFYHDKKKNGYNFIFAIIITNKTIQLFTRIEFLYFCYHNCVREKNRGKILLLSVNKYYIQNRAYNINKIRYGMV